jgi:hypothetical protein
MNAEEECVQKKLVVFFEMCQKSKIFECVDLWSNEIRRMCKNPAVF